MDYFFCPPERITATSLTIEGEEFAHLVHVMRAKEGDEIRVVDGAGNAYDVRLGEISKKMVRAAIQHVEHHHHEPDVELTLAVGVLKNPSKFDFIVEKATELGVRTIIPFTSERTIPHHAKSDRWQKLALAAMKQSGRSYLPLIRELCTLKEVLGESASYELKYIAHERLAGPSPAVVRGPGDKRTCIVLVGPEGGFSEEEFRTATELGYEQIYLGERRLRTETASIVICSMLTD